MQTSDFQNNNNFQSKSVLNKALLYLKYLNQQINDLKVFYEVYP